MNSLTRRRFGLLSGAALLSALLPKPALAATGSVYIKVIKGGWWFGGQGGTGSDLKRRGPGHHRGQKMAGRLSLLDRPLEVTPERKVLLPCDGRSQGNSGLQTGNGLPRMLLESPGNPGIRQKEGAQIASSRSGPVSIQCRRQQFLEKLALKPGFPGSIQVLHESIGIIPGTKFRMKMGRPYR